MPQVDGRILRSQKSQSVILNALIKLINTGNYYPTAEEVAKESGIAIRTVFRQFDDMESLLMKVDELINHKLINDEKEIKLNSPLIARIELIIKERLHYYNKYENIMIATITQLPKYKILQKKYPEYQRLLRKRTENIIPEILTLKSNNQELLDATLSFGFYQRLKFQGLDKSNIYKLINEQCKKLIMSGGESYEG
jgi:AraC-like DNA-binding protein